MLVNVSKWLAIPVMLTGAALSRYAGPYELRVDLIMCMVALIAVALGIWKKDFGWGCGMLVTAVVFSPFGLAAKIFALLVLAVATVVAILIVTWRMQVPPASDPAM